MSVVALKKDLKLSFCFYVSLCPSIFLISFAFTEVLGSLNPIIAGFCIVFIYTILFTIRYFGLISLYSIFLYTSAFFVYDCFPFTLFGGKDFLLQTFPIVYRIDESVGLIFVFVCFVSVYVMHIVYCVTRKEKYKKLPIMQENEALKNTGIIVMLVFFIPVVAKGLIQLRYVMSHGYLEVFMGGLNDIKYPFWTTGAFLFFTAGFAIFFASNPPKKVFIIFSILYLLVFFISSMKGQRGYILSVLLAIVYILRNKYDMKFNFKKIVMLGIVVFAFTAFLGSFRESYGKNEKSKSKSKISDLVIDTLYGQTNTRAVPLLIIRGDLEYHNYPFVLSPLTGIFTSYIYGLNGQSTLSAEKMNDISQVTMYNVSKKHLLSGNGYGGAFLGEAYDFFGFFGVILFSVIFGVFFVFCDYSKLRVKNMFAPLLFFIISYLPLLPRDRVFKYAGDIYKILLAYFLCFIVFTRKYIFLTEIKSREGK